MTLMVLAWATEKKKKMELPSTEIRRLKVRQVSGGKTEYSVRDMLSS